MQSYFINTSKETHHYSQTIDTMKDCQVPIFKKILFIQFRYYDLKNQFESKKVLVKQVTML